jgi:hypothetical protein
MRHHFSILLFGVLLCAGCSRDSKPSGRVPPPTPEVGSTIDYKPAPGWVAYDAKSSMRHASYEVKDAAGHMVDIAITTLGAVVGKDLAYINLWRATLGLKEPLQETEDDLFVEARYGSYDFDIFDQTSPTAIIGGERHARIYLASLTQGKTRWFFKMAGDAELLATQIPAFQEMLKSVRFASE